MPAKRKQHYVDNKLFLAKIIEYRQSIEEARLLDKPKPRIPHYLGECFFKNSNTSILQTKLYKLYV